MIKDAGIKHCDYSMLPNFWQILLQGLSINWKICFLFINSTNLCIKMSHYQCNRQEILQKAKYRHSKDYYLKQLLLLIIAADYYLKNKEAIKENSKSWYKNLSKDEKYKIKKYQRNRLQQLIQYKNEVLQSK